MGLIQTADQLRFSYLAVIEGAKFIMGDASVQVSGAVVVLGSLSVLRKAQTLPCACHGH